MKIVLPVLIASYLGAMPVAQSIGLVTDTTTNRAILFDADSYQSLGSVALPAHADPCYGECILSPDGTLAYVSGFNSGVFVIDVTTRPPSPASGINPIPITKPPGGRMDITPDGRFLVIAGLWIMTVDLETRTEVATFDPIGNASGISAGSPGSVLVTFPNNLNLRRFIMAPDGPLTDSGEQINVVGARDVALTPSGDFGICASDESPFLLRSFRSSPLTLLESRTFRGGTGLTLNPAGTRVYVRGLSLLQAFTFDPLSGHIGAEALFQLPMPPESCLFGGPVFHPDGTRFFYTVNEQVLVLDPDDGHLLGRVTDPQMVTPKVVAVRAGPEAF